LATNTKHKYWSSISYQLQQ